MAHEHPPAAPNAADRLAARRATWAEGAKVAADLDLERVRAMTPEQRIEEGLSLVRIAAKLRAGRAQP